ncbi:OB-fold protein [Chryseobacterium pennae]|nr:hypothetical protein [Chryseobacterium pennae]
MSIKIKNFTLQIALLAISCLGLAFSMAPKNDITNKNDKTMSLKELHNAFVKDESTALKKYGEKIVEIQGYVTYVGPDIYGLPSIELSDKKAGKTLALCVLPTLDYLKLRKYSKGEELLIQGKVRAFWEKGSQVVIKESKVLEKK